MREIEKWLIANKDTLRIRAIERKIGCPVDTLRKVVDGSQKLPEKWVKPLRDYIQNICKETKKL